MLLIGGSSVGKTRCAFEAVRALLPEWWLVHPAGPGDVAALSAAPVARTVVWLDELQRYLDGEHGLTGGVIRALLNALYPAVVISTLWPDWYTAYTTVPKYTAKATECAANGADPHAREREVPDLAAVVRISPQFTPAEQHRARAAAARDKRLQVALDAAGYGLTQTLAAAPQLVARWEDARTVHPYAWAVLTAALDAARLGARAPLSADFLRAAAPGYCNSQQQAKAPDNWLEQALAYATEELHGAAAALSPSGEGMGQVAGYIAADYLIQHASRERRFARVPASTWDAILNHISDPADTVRLADSAERRLLYRYATPLYRHAADAGDRDANSRLVNLFFMRGDVDELRTRADAGDSWAAERLAELLAGRGHVDGLRALADADTVGAASQLADLLAGRGGVDGLRALADAGESHAARLLVDLLAERGDVDGAERILRALADAGDWHANWRLAELPVDLLFMRGDVDGLRSLADAGESHAARLLALHAGLDELRAFADAGNCHAGGLLAGLLVARGDLDELRTRVDAADPCAANALVDLLIKQGRSEEAERLRRFGLNPDGSIACA